MPPLLPEPASILDLPDGGTVSFHVLRWEEGDLYIVPKPPREPVRQRITALRVYVPPEDKPTLPYYWDITAKTLRWGLLQYLRRPGFEKLLFTITKHGVAPTARFTLRVE